MTKQRITLDTLTEENVDDSGSITLEESHHIPEMHLNFSNLDQNKNDELEEAELQLSNVQLSFEHIDINQDLVITYDEATALPRLSENFEKLDRNNDQALTPDEFESYAIRD